jgi:hypothetical protein
MSRKADAGWIGISIPSTHQVFLVKYFWQMLGKKLTYMLKYAFHLLDNSICLDFKMVSYFYVNTIGNYLNDNTLQMYFP